MYLLYMGQKSLKATARFPVLTSETLNTEDANELTLSKPVETT